TTSQGVDRDHAPGESRQGSGAPLGLGQPEDRIEHTMTNTARAEHLSSPRCSEFMRPTPIGSIEPESATTGTDTLVLPRDPVGALVRRGRMGGGVGSVPRSDWCRG